MVPQYLQDLYAPVVNWEVPWSDLNLVLGPVPPLDEPVPHSLVYRRVAWVTAKARSGNGLRVVGATVGNTVYLDLKPDQVNTAAGLALAAHELWHVKQRQSIPDFDRLYNEYAAKTPADQPWKNPLELEAYQVEAREYCRAIAEGKRRGPWLPLGVRLWGCT